MRRQEHRTYQPPVEHRLVLLSVTCDLCGEPVRPQLRSGDIQDTPGRFVGDFKCERNQTWTADLCAGCTASVRAFIDAGPGPGCQKTVYDPMGG